MARAFRTLSLLAVVAFAAGCSIEEAPAPSLTGPSELSLSLTMAATPDTIAQDGSSQALVVVVARDVSGRAVANLPLRFDVMKNGQIVDYGGLSTKTGLTGTDGRAQVVYTAPTPPLNSPTPTPVAAPPTVSVLATPTGANYANAVARSVDIRLIPPGTIYDPGTGPVASFTASPDFRVAGQPVVFDAKTSSSPAGLVSYAWDFGNGSTGAGVTTQHAFEAGGTYLVRLTVTDKKGQTAWVTNPVTVASGPTALFTWAQQASPGPPTVDFDGGASWVVPPATFITSYTWDCGRGTQVSPFPPNPTNPRATCVFPSSGGPFSVTLVVKDDKNGVGRLTQTIALQ